jgi:hypothetical protein
MKHIKLIVIFWTSLVILSGCKEYNRDNPNDLLANIDGSYRLTYKAMQVSEDLSKDAKIQISESGKITVSINNEGDKITPKIKSVLLTSVGGEISFSNEKALTEFVYVGIDNKVVSADFVVSSSITKQKDIEVWTTIEFVNGEKSVVKFNLTIFEANPSFISIQTAIIYGYDELGNGNVGSYSKSLIPVLFVRLKNNSSNDYSGKLIGTLSLNHPTFGFRLPFEKYDVYIAAGTTEDFYIQLDCFPKNITDNYSSTLQLSMMDDFLGALTKDVSLTHATSTLKANFRYFYTPGTLTPGSYFDFDVNVENTGIRDLDLTQIPPVVTSSSSNITILSIERRVSFPIPAGTTEEGAFVVKARIKPTAVSGESFSFGITYSASSNCPQTFQSSVGATVE